MSNGIKNTENVIGENSVFEGTITLSETLRVNGSYIGEKLSIKHIIVGKPGKVKSDFECESLVVEGAILGNILSSVRTMLLPTAKILGNISSPELIIQKGVIWDGHCQINTDSSTNVSETIHNIFK